MAEQPKNQSCANCRNYQMAALQIDESGRVLYRDSAMVCKLNPPDTYPGRERHRPIGMGYVDTEEFLWCSRWEPANPETIDDAAVTSARLVLLGDRTGVYALVDRLQEKRNG